MREAILCLQGFLTQQVQFKQCIYTAKCSDDHLAAIGEGLCKAEDSRASTCPLSGIKTTLNLYT